MDLGPYEVRSLGDCLIDSPLDLPNSPHAGIAGYVSDSLRIGLSIEQQLVTEVTSIVITPHKGPNSKVRVRDVIYKWLGHDYPDPYRELIRRVEQLATTTGWYEVVQVRRGSLAVIDERFVITAARANRPHPAGVTIRARAHMMVFEELAP